MKKFLYSTFVCLMVALVGCESADITINAIDAPTKKVTITADIQGSDATRVVLTPESTDGKNTIKVEWKERGETFIVYGDDGGGYLGPNAIFTQTTGNEFEAEMTGDWYPRLACYGNHEIVNGIITYELSEQDGTLNEDYVIMAAGVENLNGHINFVHKTAILKPTFRLDGMDIDGEITKIVVGNAYAHSTNTELNTITVTPTTAIDDIYIFLLRDGATYVAGHKFTFDITIDGTLYKGELTIPENMSIVAGKYYTADINLSTEEGVLPNGITICNTIKSITNGKYWYNDDLEVIFETNVDLDSKKPEEEGALAVLNYTIEGGTDVYMKFIHRSDRPKIYIYTDKPRLRFDPDCSVMFSGTRVGYVTFPEAIYINTSKVTNMEQMFMGCNRLLAFNLGGFSAKSVNNMSKMFYNCINLPEINLSGMTTADNVDMSYMFYGCELLQTANLSGITTGNNVNLMAMFFDCTSLTGVDFTGSTTEKFANMSHMFNGCTALTSLDFSNFDTAQATAMEFMFQNCTALETLTFGSNFTASKVKTMQYMFQNCSKLERLDLKSFVPASATNMQSMFEDCNLLMIVDVSNFNTENVTDMSFMFKNCYSLGNLNLRSFLTPKVTTMASMFEECVSIDKLNIYYFDLSSITRDDKGLMTGIKDMLKHLSNNYSTAKIYATQELHGLLGTTVVEDDLETYLTGINYAHTSFSYYDLNF